MQRFRIEADADDLWQTVQTGLFGEKQAQLLMLQLCLLTAGIREWIECSLLNHLLYIIYRRSANCRVSSKPLWGRMEKRRGEDEEEEEGDDDGGDDDDDYNYDDDEEDC